MTMKILLANPRGFCAGVHRAIDIVDRALEILGPPIYVRHEVVHNQFVVHGLRARGAIFTDDMNDIPPESVVIFSAHGVPQTVRDQAKAMRLKIFDATCPLVTKVHLEVTRFSRLGQECILIGHAGHPEVEGTMGQYHNPQGGIYLVENVSDVDALQVKNPQWLAYVTQTTLSVDDTAEVIAALRKRFPHIQGAKREDICYATQNRQDAVKDLAIRSEVVIVVGSVNSSNSNRLRELAERLGCEAYLVDSADEVQNAWVVGKRMVGVTAGASAPEILVQEVVAKLKALGGVELEELQGKQESIVFALPKELR